MLFNFKKEAVDVNVKQRLPEGKWVVTQHGRGGVSVDPRAFEHKIEPLGTAIFFFRKDELR